MVNFEKINNYLIFNHNTLAIGTYSDNVRSYRHKHEAQRPPITKTTKLQKWIENCLITISSYK